MKKAIRFIIISAAVFAATLFVVNAQGEYTINEYIKAYCSETYAETDAVFDRITIQIAGRNNELWVLPESLSEYGVFESKIEKAENTYPVQTEERYYITLQSKNGNILYLCITKNGELFFGRLADSDKTNYCEYIASEPETVYAGLSQICQTGINGYVNQSVTEGVPECSDWAREAVTKAAAKSFIPSVLLNYHFSENAERIDFCRMAYRMLNEKAQIDGNKCTHPFADVDKDEWELAYLYENGIIKGKTETEFCPNDSISREEAATILYRLFNFVYKTDSQGTVGEKNYADDNEISDWAKNSVYSMKTHGIMIGVSDNLFSPKAPFSLEQTVVALLRIYEYN